MLVIVLFFSSAIASAWGAIHDMLMHKCLEAPGLGTVVSDAIALKVDGGDSTVLLKCLCQCLGGGPTMKPECTYVWKHPARASSAPILVSSRLMVVMVLFFSSAVASAWSKRDMRRANCVR